MTAILQTARFTVDELLERRHRLNTYEEQVQHALDLVYMHFETENPERIDECIRLYADDAEWEAPARRGLIPGSARLPARRARNRCHSPGVYLIACSFTFRVQLRCRGPARAGSLPGKCGLKGQPGGRG